MGVLALVVCDFLFITFSKYIQAFLHGDTMNKLGLYGCFSSGCM